MFIAVIDVEKNLTLAKHRHYGAVYDYTLSGSYGYVEAKEYWMAKTGDLVTDDGGTPHTLFTPENTGTQIFFWGYGALEFFDQQGNHDFLLDWRTLADMYYQFCKNKENNTPCYNIVASHRNGALTQARDYYYKTSKKINQDSVPGQCASP